jgi:hypothetical protein
MNEGILRSRPAFLTFVLLAAALSIMNAGGRRLQEHPIIVISAHLCSCFCVFAALLVLLLSSTRGERRGFGGAQLPSNRLVFLPAYAVERTHDEFARLFARAGWSLQRVISTACPLSVLEAVPALDSG